MCTDMSRNWCLILLALMGNLMTTAAYGQAVRSELGAVYSPKEIGVTYTSSSSSGAPWHMVRIVADVMEVVKGENREPGVRGEYFIAYPLMTWESVNGNVIDVVAGPGTVLGLIRDHRSFHYSALAGLQGMFGIYGHISSGFVLGVSFSGGFGLCFSAKDSHDTKLSYWKHGIYQAFIPEISIAYRF